MQSITLQNLPQTKWISLVCYLGSWWQQIKTQHFSSLMFRDRAEAFKNLSRPIHWYVWIKVLQKEKNIKRHSLSLQRSFSNWFFSIKMLLICFIPISVRHKDYKISALYQTEIFNTVLETLQLAHKVLPVRNIKSIPKGTFLCGLCMFSSWMCEFFFKHPGFLPESKSILNLSIKDPK